VSEISRNRRLNQQLDLVFQRATETFCSSSRREPPDETGSRRSKIASPRRRSTIRFYASCLCGRLNTALTFSRFLPLNRSGVSSMIRGVAGGAREAVFACPKRGNRINSEGLNRVLARRARWHGEECRRES